MRVRRTAAMAVATLVAAVMVVPALARPARPSWLPERWYRIGICETGLDWRHSTTDYGGAFGFYRGSWDAYKPAGYPAEPEYATPRQQYVVALAIATPANDGRAHGLGGWGCVTRRDALGDWVRAAW